MEYEFLLQDPVSGNTALVDQVIAAMEDADECRGLFAFASRNGVDEFFGSPQAIEFLRRGTCRIVVGIDAVTTRAALERLRELESWHPGFEARVFDNTSGRLFHPKLCYFRHQDGGQTLIVGSGNLTPGGLSGNYEAFTVIRAAPGEELDLSAWDGFLGDHGGDLRPITDEALRRADQNVIRGGGGRGAGAGRPQPVEADIVAPPEEIEEEAGPLNPEVLVGFAPRAGGRWNQLHLNSDVISSFFRIPAHSGEPLLLRQISAGGATGPLEDRRLVYSTSNKNWKVEIGAAHGVAYPPDEDGRPVVLFVQRAPRSFDYVLLLPGNPGHAELSRMLETAPDKIGRGVERVIRRLDRVRATWPGCPL